MTGTPKDHPAQPTDKSSLDRLCELRPTIERVQADARHNGDALLQHFMGELLNSLEVPSEAEAEAARMLASKQQAAAREFHAVRALFPELGPLNTKTR
jgi:hypothetical protein